MSDLIDDINELIDENDSYIVSKAKLKQLIVNHESFKTKSDKTSIGEIVAILLYELIFITAIYFYIKPLFKQPNLDYYINELCRILQNSLNGIKILIYEMRLFY